MAAPTYQAAGSAVNATTGTLSVAWPTHAVGDVALLFVESSTGTIALGTASGFVQVGTQRDATGTRLAVFWARATSASMANPVLTAQSNHQYAVILTFRGCSPTGVPFTSAVGSTKSSASTSTVLPAVTTVGPDQLIVGALTKDLDSTAAFVSAFSNANLTSVTERFDAGTSSGDGGGIAVFTGVKATAGDTGTTTATVTSSTSAMMTVAFIDGPGAPTTSLTSGDRYIDVSWTDPTHLGSSTSIIGRQYTTDGGTTWRYLLRFNTTGTIGIDESVRAIAIQSDGKIIVGGVYTTARGTTQNRITRLHTDGTVDTSFNTGGTVGVGNTVHEIAIQSDGKILIGGEFTTVRGTTQNRIARLNTDGTLDTGFNTGGTVGVNLDGVRTIAIQSDGKIIIGGPFTTARGTTQNYIARLNTDGTLDTGFNTGGTVGTSGSVRVARIQSDGKIFIGGVFTTVRGTTQNRIARLNTDGTLDTSFNTGGTVGVTAAVQTAVIQPDGKIIIGGLFAAARGTTRNRIARLETDGTLDTSFNTGGTVGVAGATTPTVHAVALQPDGKIIVGGEFTTARGTTQNYIARLDADGMLDTGFNTGGTVGVDDVVYAAALQHDGRVVIGGNFIAARGTTQNRIARLLDTDGTLEADTSLPYRVYETSAV
jgi:uncharacterized delta-60 repeat protein